MKREWYILVEEKREGPFNVMDLRRDRRVTPDTLVWKSGFETWVPIRNVPELDAVFGEEEPVEEKESEFIRPLNEEIVLYIKRGGPQFFIWFLIALIILGYLFYATYRF